MLLSHRALVAIVMISSLVLAACSNRAADRGSMVQDEKQVLQQPAAEPTPVVQKIDWSAVEQHPQLSADLKALVPERIAKLPLPVLLPPQQRWLIDAQLTSGPRWYAASLRTDGHIVYVSGNAVAKRVPAVAKRVSALPPRSMPDLRVSSSDGILSATWQRFGVTYLVTVECDEPQRDPRCTEQQYVRRLVDTVVVAGGTP